MRYEDFERMVVETPEIAALNGRYDVDTVKEWIEEVSICSLPHLVKKVAGYEYSHKTIIRHFAAIFFDQSVSSAAYKVMRVINNNSLGIHDLVDILTGDKDEIPFPVLQEVARRLTLGESTDSIVRSLRLGDRKTVVLVDRLAGIRIARKDRLIGKAISQLQDLDTSSQAFARRNGLTRTEGENIMREAKKILEELT